MIVSEPKAETSARKHQHLLTLAGIANELDIHAKASVALNKAMDEVIPKAMAHGASWSEMASFAGVEKTAFWNRFKRRSVRKAAGAT